MKQKYRIYRRDNGIFYLENTETGEQKTLKTKDRKTAKELQAAENKSQQENRLNFELGKIYLRAADEEMANRTWKDVLAEICLNGKEQGAHKTFESVEAFEKWFVDERAFWTKLEVGSQYTPRVLWDHLSERGMNAVVGQIGQAKEADERRRRAAIDSIVNFCANIFEQNGVFTSASPNAKFISQLAETSGPVVAAHAAAYLLGLNSAYDGHDQITGALEAFCFEQGLKKRGPAEEGAMAQMRTNWEIEFQTLKNAQKTEVGTLKQQIAEREGQITELKNHFGAFFKQSKTEWAEKIALYEEKLALSAPATYWKRKAKTHAWGSAIFGVVTLGSGIFAVSELRTLAEVLLKAPQGTAADKWHPDYWQTAGFLIGAAFAIWVLRILVKLLLSQIHLQSDASERVTMVNTYLALLEAKKATDDDRKLIMAALFRPAATGVVKDEGMPFPTLETITRTGKP